VDASTMGQMTDQTIRQSELAGRAVMAYETAEDIGALEHLLVDVKRARVVGMVCKGLGLMGRKQMLSWPQLANIGRDSLVVHTAAPANIPTSTPTDAAPLRIDAGEAELAAAQNVTGLEVWTDGGDHIGRVVDLCVDRATGEVQQYLFALNSALGSALNSVSQPNDATRSLPNINASDAAESKSEPESESPDADGSALEPEAAVSVYAIAPQAIISAGRKRMMIAEEDAQRSQPYGPAMILNAPTVSMPLGRAKHLPEIPADFGELLHKGQSFAGKVSEQVRQRARQFTDEQLAHSDSSEGDALPDITEQLQSKTAQVKEQMQAQLRKASRKARETAQDQMDSDLAHRLGSTPLGRSLGQTLNRFKRPAADEQAEPIDVASFEVWEDD
jgi:uncharacterized protein YrrD/Sec-independent protein translocase protein TatA